MAKAAAATAALDKSLNDLDGELARSHQSTTTASRDIDGLGNSLKRNGAEIDKFSGRLRLMVDTAAILGPSVLPISAVAVPAITGLASQLGFATLGMGSLVVASQGVGDALKAVNDAALEPTAANLEKAHEAMAKLGPEAQKFVSRFQELRPVLGDIRDAAAAGWFPGLTEALDHFEDVAPRVADIFEVIGRTGGNLVAEGAETLAGPEFAEFLAFVEDSAPQALDDLGRTVGNVIRGLSELWMAFDPLNDDFSSWLLDASRSFAEWSDGLSQTQGFEDFVDYIRTNGPRVADALVAVADAVLQIIEALAPLGGPSLQIIESFAKVIGAIADSDMGTPILAAVSALAIYNRTMAVAIGLQTKLAAGGGMVGKPGTAAAAAGGQGGLLAMAAIIKAGQVKEEVDQTASGEQGAFDGFLRTMVPALTVPGLLGFDLPALGGNEKADGELVDIRKELTRATNDAAFAQSEFGSQLRRMPALASQSTESLTYMSEALTKSRASARDGADSFVNLGDSLDDADISLSGWLAELERNSKALVDFGRNAKSAAKKGLDDGLIASLQEAGEQGALRLQQLAGSTEAEIKRANRAWRQGERAIDGYIDTVGGVPETVATDVRLTGLQSARAALRHLRDDIIGNPITQTVNVKVNGKNVKADVGTPGSVNDLLGGGRASGGFTGPGGKYDPAGIVHRGEVVIPQELVQRDKGLLMSRYGHLPNMNELPGMATGGLGVGRIPAYADSQWIRVPPPPPPPIAPMAGVGALQHELRIANERLAAIEGTIRDEHHGDRKSMRSGAGAISRSRPRGRI